MSTRTHPKLRALSLVGLLFFIAVPVLLLLVSGVPALDDIVPAGVSAGATGSDGSLSTALGIQLPGGNSDLWLWVGGGVVLPFLVLGSLLVYGLMPLRSSSTADGSSTSWSSTGDDDSDVDDGSPSAADGSDSTDPLASPTDSGNDFEWDGDGANDANDVNDADDADYADAPDNTDAAGGVAASPTEPASTIPESLSTAPESLTLLDAQVALSNYRYRETVELAYWLARERLAADLGGTGSHSRTHREFLVAYQSTNPGAYESQTAFTRLTELYERSQDDPESVSKADAESAVEQAAALLDPDADSTANGSDSSTP